MCQVQGNRCHQHTVSETHEHRVMGMCLGRTDTARTHAGQHSVTGAPVCGAALCTDVTQPGLLTHEALEEATDLMAGHTDI